MALATSQRRRARRADATVQATDHVGTTLSVEYRQTVIKFYHVGIFEV